MARKRKRRDKLSRAPSESRTADVATVAWMLAVMITLFCEAAAIMAAIFQGHEMMRVLLVLMWLSAIVTGLIALILTPVVLRLRRLAPPRGITVFAIIVSATPLIAMFVRLLV